MKRIFVKATAISLLAIMSASFFASCTKDDIFNEEQKPEQEEEPTPVDPYDLAAALEGHGPEAGADIIGTIPPPVMATPGLTWASVGTSVLTGCASGLGSFLVNKALNAICGAIFGSESQELVLLENVVTRLESVESKLDNLTHIAESIYEKLDETELNAIMSSFKAIDAQLVAMSTVNTFYYERLQKASSEEEVKAIITEWGSTSINGNPAYGAVMTLAKSILGFTYTYNGAYVNYCSVYDMIVFDNVAWENIGYDYRDMYRAAAAVNIARGFYLAFAYYSLFQAESSMQQVVTTAEQMASFFESCPVVRDNDHAICQLKGAHFRLPVDCLEAHDPWIVSHHGMSSHTSSGYTSVQYLMVTQPDVFTLYNAFDNPDGYVKKEDRLWQAVQEKENQEAFIKGQLTSEEVRTIMNYYLNTDDRAYTFMDILALGGVKVKEEYRPSIAQTSPDRFILSSEVYFGTADTSIDGFHDDGDKWYTTNKSDCHRLSVSNYFMACLPVRAVYEGVPVAEPRYVEHFSGTEEPDNLRLNVSEWGQTMTVIRPGDGKAVSRKYAVRFSSYGCHEGTHLPGDYFLMLKLGALERY